jgi:hypothetical protein
VAAAGPGCGQPGGRTFADQDAFELGQGGKTWKTSLPPGVVVSIASCRLRNPIPRPASSPRRSPFLADLLALRRVLARFFGVFMGVNVA